MSLALQKFGEKIQVISTQCTETSYQQLGEDLGRYCKVSNEIPLAVDFTNVHIVAMRDSDVEFRKMTDAMDFFVPDSTVLTWAANLRGARMKDRVYGPGFLSHMIESTPEHLTHFFLGASQDCLDELLANIKRRNPNFKIVGSRNGYFGADDEEAVLSEINAAQADLIWVGLGTPKQQEWISRFKQRVKGGALLAVGFAFDVNAGTKKDAPIWIQKYGLTWFYRFTQEPSRLWERYLVYNSMFVSRLAKQIQNEGLNGRLTYLSASKPKNSTAAVSVAPLTLHERAESSFLEEADFPCGKRTNVLGVGISVTDLENSARSVVAATERKGARYVTVTGVHGVMESQRDKKLKEIHNSSFLSTPDGMPMVWMGKWNGNPKIERVYGPDLMLKVTEKSAVKKQKHFFFGGKEGIAEELGEIFSSWFEGVEVVGAVSPPFRPLSEIEERDLVEQLNNVQPHYLWVGLSTPKQELFMHGLCSRYPDLGKDWSHGLVMLGVGAAFDFHTGRLAQAPRLMQKNGLEWFFRLLMEPRRLFRRYSINNSTFVWSAFQQMTRMKEFPSSNQVD